MILLLPAVAPVSLLFGSMHRGGFVSVLGLRIVVQDVAASFFYALLRQPYLRPRRCGDFGMVSRHKPADVSAIPDVAASLSHAGERLRDQRLSHAGVRLRYQRLSHTGSGCEINASLTIRSRQPVMARPRASRSSSHRDERWEGCWV